MNEMRFPNWAAMMAAGREQGALFNEHITLVVEELEAVKEILGEPMVDLQEHEFRNGADAEIVGHALAALNEAFGIIEALQATLRWHPSGSQVP